MSTPFARLRDTFLDGTDPLAALFCTYGFDAPFFEAEILPAAFPVRLNLDPLAGSRAAYLAAADQAMQASSVMVFFDHLAGDGPGLPYVASRVDVKPRAFHPKLILLGYADRIRAVVSSANLTRPAWTSLLELFLVEDLTIGTPHPWSEPLRRFLSRLEAHLPAERRDDLRELSGRLRSTPQGGGGPRLLSSWDGPLLPRFSDGFGDVSRVDVVTPFFEGDEGKGVLDQLATLGSRVAGRLFVAAQAAEGRLEIRGPREKIDRLLASRRWTLHRVAEEWVGDEEGAPLRALHGKLLAIRSGRSARVMVGSANVTRAALLGSPPVGNVELVGVLGLSPSQVSHLLPQSSPLARTDVEIIAGSDPTGEDDDISVGAEKWVEGAIYWARDSAVELRLVADAPQLRISYEGVPIGTVTASGDRVGLTLRESFAVEVADGDTVGIVPLALADPAAFVPRGISGSLDFETFCELLAGTRELELPAGELPRTGAGLGDGDMGLAPRRGAIPWRRILAAIRGLGTTLAEEAPFPRGVEFALNNPTRLAGLLSRLEEEEQEGRFQSADRAYALHEIRRMLEQAAGAMVENPDSAELVRAAAVSVTTKFEEIRHAAGDDVATQLHILSTELPA